MGRPRSADTDAAAIATERLAGLLAELRPERADDPTDPPGAGGDRGQVHAAPRREQARSFGRRHLAVLSILLVLGLAAAGWALLRARPLAVATPIELTTTAAPGPQTSRPATPGPPAAAATGRASPQTSPSAALLVHVIGAVRRPGVVSLPAGARVQDALRAAGGLRAGARPGELNLAQPVQDGQQIVIGTRKDPGGEVRTAGVPPASDGAGTSDGAGASDGAGSAGGTGSAAAPIDLNSATLAQLDTLPGVGPVTAERILAWRSEHGRFSSVEELQEVDGIGPKTYAQLAPHVRV